jgi:hypothetical protein
MSISVSELIRESKEIRAKGSEIRGQAISSQIRAGITQCHAARQCFRSGNTTSGNKIIAKLVYAILKIEHHLSEPQHVPADDLPALLGKLEQLKKELQAVQADLH